MAQDRRLEPLRERMHEMVDSLFDDMPIVPYAADGAFPTLRLTVENSQGMTIDLVVAILPEGHDVPVFLDS